MYTVKQMIKYLSQFHEDYIVYVDRSPNGEYSEIKASPIEKWDEKDWENNNESNVL